MWIVGLLQKLEFSSETSGDITRPGEIAELLKAVKDYYWSFSYLRMVGKRIVSHEIQLTDVSERRGTFTVVGLSADRDSSGRQEFFFRASSGGMSITFKANRDCYADDFEAAGNQFSLPDSAHFSQLRSAIRVNIIDIEEIPVMFHADAQNRFTGKVIDLSESGAKIRFEGNLTEFLACDDIIADCEMRLPQDSVIASRVKVVGCIHDTGKDASYVRCQFMQLHVDSELHLHQLIYRALQQMGFDHAMAG
ncbi:MAG: PilZ domain-containing protein [Gammaproteobacteria bacterium]